MLDLCTLYKNFDQSYAENENANFFPVGPVLFMLEDAKEGSTTRKICPKNAAKSDFFQKINFP